MPEQLIAPADPFLLLITAGLAVAISIFILITVWFAAQIVALNAVLKANRERHKEANNRASKAQKGNK